MPDIILLPEIATYFDITVDELLGYEPQLSREQIKKVYGELLFVFITDLCALADSGVYDGLQ